MDHFRLRPIKNELFSIGSLKKHKPNDNIQYSWQRQVDNIVEQGNSEDDSCENKENGE